MLYLQFLLIETAASALILVPALVVLEKAVFHAPRDFPAYLVLTLYLSAVYAATGLPTAAYIRVEPNINWVPFLDMAADFRNAMLNILMFVPLGILLPLLWQAYRTPRKTILFGLGASAAIELLQIFTSRATDINDLITNTVGSVLGYALFRLLPIRPIGKPLRDLPILCAVTFFTMFFLQPFVCEWLRLLL